VIQITILLPWRESFAGAPHRGMIRPFIRDGRRPETWFRWHGRAKAIVATPRVRVPNATSDRAAYLRHTMVELAA
jgi:hypothetical protein